MRHLSAVIASGVRLSRIDLDEAELVVRGAHTAADREPTIGDAHRAAVVGVAVMARLPSTSIACTLSNAIASPATTRTA
jgi:hypothetical protein